MALVDWLVGVWYNIRLQTERCHVKIWWLVGRPVGRSVGETVLNALVEPSRKTKQEG
jgi:hypothetical protein